MKRKLKFSVTLIILVSSILMLMGGKSQATLQSNPNTHYKQTKKFVSWLSEIRNMEAINGAMGLSEEKNTNLTSTKSNNIDVHLMKSTEYGAIAILSASGYGNPSNENAITSTTGNNTGMLINISEREWVAGAANADVANHVEERYYNAYGSAKVGDATECRGWHGTPNDYDHATLPNYYLSAFYRGFGGIFAYCGKCNNSWTYGHAHPSYGYFGRGVAVCGEGL